MKKLKFVFLLPLTFCISFFDHCCCLSVKSAISKGIRSENSIPLAAKLCSDFHSGVGLNNYDKAENDVLIFNDYTSLSRKSFVSGITSFIISNTIMSMGLESASAEETTSSPIPIAVPLSAQAIVTAKVFIDLKGLPIEDNDTGERNLSNPNRIIIGLFGKDAPQSVSILQQLFSPNGFPSKCKPAEKRLLQREQLEANKVYRSCIDLQDVKGVTYDLSSVWRVVTDERIDLGAVSGKFVSREYPNFIEENGTNKLTHDTEGVVSVRKGNNSGFGFTIYPGRTSYSDTVKDLDEDNIVVGRVLEGMDVVKKLNSVAVVQKGFGATSVTKKDGPSRACRYGSSETYCNEFKPLRKILISNTGVL